VLLGNSGWSTKLVVGGSEQNSPSLCGLLKVKGETRVWEKLTLSFIMKNAKDQGWVLNFF
jgi:hypothetical protein